MSETIDHHAVREYLCQFQQSVCEMLESEECGQRFIKDAWQYDSGGGGESRVLEQGEVFEKAGVNFSHIVGQQLPPSASQLRPELAGQAFTAMGVSMVIHPRNPYVPTTHANFRFFMTTGDKPVWWFGGGFDLTPYYGFVEDCVHWHQMAYDACEPYGHDIYAQYKKACDDYFFLPHRNEARGIGGLFFDDVNQWPFEQCFAFIKHCSAHFNLAYQPIVAKRKNIDYGEREREFQLYRRGRYVEFNLLQDRGTLFGIQSRGRTESILMSLPPLVNWRYNWQPAAGSKEAELYEQFLPAQDWLKRGQVISNDD